MNDELKNTPRPDAAPAPSAIPGLKPGSSQHVASVAMRARAAWSNQDMVGEQRAFNELISAVMGELLVYARARIGPGEVEDVVAETLVRFLREVRSDKRMNNVVSLLFTILRNQIIDRLRRKKVVHGVTGDELLRLQAAKLAPVPGAEDEAISQMEVNRILAQVPHAERVVLYLRFVHDLSVEEVATRTGLSIDQVKKRTAAGIRHLKEVTR